MPDSLQALLEGLAAAPPRDPGELRARLRAGERIGRFEILREIGRGGFGLVFEARDTELGRHVAVKIARADADPAASARRLEQLRREAEAAARFAHPNIVTLHDFGLHEGSPYLVLELVEGETLQQRLERGSLPLPEALSIALQIASALAHAHAAGVLHRDLKPANVVLGADGRARLLDLGLARLFDDPDAARGGTPGFAAPEQWNGGFEDERTDVFGAGSLLRAMVAGAAEAPPSLPALIARCVSTDPAARPQSARELARELLAIRDAVTQELQGEPYRWLEPFGVDDGAWFFGREAEIARLERLVRSRSLVCVTGASGAGKSSLVRAGLLPRLRRGQGWSTAVMRPGADPLLALAERTSCGGDLLGQPALVGSALREQARRNGARVVLFVDQLEELYTLLASRAQRVAFAAALAAAADDDDGPVRVVLAIREDFLSSLSEHPPLRDRASSGMFLLGPPDETSLAEAVRGPARRAGFEIEAGLAEEVASAVAREKAPLPILQLAVSRMWQRRDQERRVVQRAALQQIGGISGVLAAHAGEVVRRLTGPAELTAARRLLFALVTPQGTRRQVAVDELLGAAADRELAARVLRHLVDGRLLTAARGERGEWVELAHEALIGAWDDLRRWVAEEREADAHRAQISAAAGAWGRRGRPRSLLWGAREVGEIDRFRAAHELPLDDLHERFLSASRSALVRAQRLRRRGTIAAIGAGVIIAAALGFAVRAWRAEARAAKRAAIARAAAEHPDPVVGALLLTELDKEREPQGGAAAAVEVSGKRIPRAVLKGHRGVVMDAVFSRDGKLVASASRDGTGALWPADGRGAPRFLTGHSGEVLGIDFSPDGSLVVTASRDGTARLWAVGGATERSVLRGHHGPVLGAAFDGRGTRVLTWSEDGTARIWPVGGGAPAVWRARAPLVGAQFSPDGSLVAAGDERGGVYLWKSDGSGADLFFSGHAADSPVRVIRFSPDGSKLLSAADDHTARLWSLDQSGDALVLAGHEGAISDARFDSRGATAVTSSFDGTARRWRTSDGAMLRIVRHGSLVRGVALASADTMLVTSGATDGLAKVWQLDDPVADPSLLWMSGDAIAQVRSLVVDARGERILAASDRTIRVFDARAPGDPLVLRGHTAAVATVQFSPGETEVVSASLDGTVRLNDLGTAAAGVFVTGERRTPGAWISRAGDLLATIANERPAGALRIFELKSGSSRRVPLPFPAFAVRVTSDGSLAIVRSEGDRIYLVRTDGRGAAVPIGGAATAPGADTRESLAALAVSDDDRSALTGHGPLDALLHALDGSRPAVSLASAGAPVIHVAFLADGAHALTASADGFVRVWSTASGAVTQSANIRYGNVRANHDGTRLALLTKNSARVVPFPRADGPAIVLSGHQGTVMDAAFTRDGRRLATASADGAVRVFSLDWETRLRALRSATSACLTTEERTQYLSETLDAAADHAAACERLQLRVLPNDVLAGVRLAP